MNENLSRMRCLVAAALLLATCALPGSAADLKRVIQCLEERERSQDPVWYKYTLKHYESAAERQGIGKVQGIPDRELRDLQDQRYDNTVEYARKGSLRFQKVSGPMRSGKLGELIERPQPSIFFSDGQKSIAYDSPQYVLVSAQRGEMMMRPEAHPAGINDEENLLTYLKETAAGETYDLTAFKDDELVDGERLCQIELLAKKTKWRTRIFLYPKHSYAPKSCEVISPNFGREWMVHDCTYREIDGVAYLQSGKRTGYGSNSKDSKERIPMDELVFEAKSIETDIRKFPDFRAEVKIAADATYNDVDLQTTSTSPEQIQSVLDKMADLSKETNDPSASSSRRWLYATFAGLATVGLLALAIVFVQTRRRRAA